MDKIGVICFEYQWINFFKYQAQHKNRFDIVPIILNENLFSRRSIKNLFSDYIYFSSLIRGGNINYFVTITFKVGLFAALYKIFNPKFKYIHWFTGQVWANYNAIKRIPFILVDMLTNLLSVKSFVDSRSQIDYLLKNKFVNNFYLPASGSICGVSDELFNIETPDFEKTVLKIGYVGRICIDKGIVDLCESILPLLKTGKIELVFYGDFDEEDDDFLNYFYQFISKNNYVSHFEYIPDKMKIYQSFDLLVMPSYREGFSNVVAEAQASSRPVICRNIYGLNSSYLPNITGISFSNVNELRQIIWDFTFNRKPLFNLSLNARKYAHDNFRSSVHNSLICKRYETFFEC